MPAIVQGRYKINVPVCNLHLHVHVHLTARSRARVHGAKFSLYMCVHYYVHVPVCILHVCLVYVHVHV